MRLPSYLRPRASSINRGAVLRHALGKICLSAAILVGTGAVQAEPATYPDKPITIVVPYPPGGSGDVVARSVGQKLTEAWGQQVLVDNRAGASGMLGTEHVAKSAPDGYTLLLATDIQFAINPVLYAKIPYDPERDFVPVAAGAVIEFALVVPTSLPVHSVDELLDLARAKPGQLSYASAGSGSTHHLTMELIKLLAGVNMTHIPYRGGAQAVPDLVSGRVQVMYLGVAQVLPHIQTGRLRALAVGSPHRLAALPGVPALAETFPGFEAQGRWDFYAPARTPAAIVEKLRTQIGRVLSSPDIIAKLSAQGLDVFAGDSESPADRNRADRRKWERVIKEAKIKVD